MEGRECTHLGARPLAHGSSGVGRSQRRDLHHPRRTGGRAKPHALERQRRACTGMVPRRSVGQLVQRCIWRVSADDRGAGWTGRPARDRAARDELRIHAILVARLAQDPLHGCRPEAVGGGRRNRCGEEIRWRPVHGPPTHDGSGLEPRLPLDRVREAAAQLLPRHSARERRDRREQASDGRSCRRDVARLGCQRQVPLVPCQHRLRAPFAVARHDVVRTAPHECAVRHGAEGW